MKLPAHVLTKLSLAGAVGAVAVIATLHAREAKREPIVYTGEADPPITVIDEPEPVPQIHFAEPPPPRPVVHKKVVKPKPRPVVSAHACGPCGMG
jgi:hypothetical protein